MAEIDVALRIPNVLIDRARALVEPVGSDLEVAIFGRVKLVWVLKLAALRGAQELARRSSLAGGIVKPLLVYRLPVRSGSRRFTMRLPRAFVGDMDELARTTTRDMEFQQFYGHKTTNRSTMFRYLVHLGLPVLERSYLTHQDW